MAIDAPTSSETPADTTGFDPPSPLPPASMDLDIASASPTTISSPLDPPSSPLLLNCVLGLAAVCPSRPVIVQNNTLGLKPSLTSTKQLTSLNPFQILTPP
ncbi:hypothetical protein Bca4012_036390 [Brassica carinata]|uniref:Uncharacterized protein n=1 Tax=Brassica carinata TaxID=52824 RepID=A0A8X7WEG2_BRACI|nr:hypothetical protein Bca52824_010118 [Brassica carinata]